MPRTAFASAAPLHLNCAKKNSNLYAHRPQPLLPRARIPFRACLEPVPPDRVPSQASSTPSSSASGPQLSSAASSKSSLSEALTEAASRALAGLQPPSADVAIVFISARYAVPKVGPRGRESLRQVVPKLRALLPNLTAVIGCCTDGVIGPGDQGYTVEIEDSPGVSLTLASLPGISVRAFHVMPDDMPSVTAPPKAWHAILGAPTPVTLDSSPSYLVFADPTFAERGELDRFLSALHTTHPHACVAGSVASTGATAVGGHMLCTLPRDVLSPDNSALRDNGLVALELRGDIEMQALVASCCRPVGPVFTACEGGSFGRVGALPDLHLLGRPATRMSAVAQLRSVIDYATPEEKRLMTADLHVGFADPDAAPEDGYVIRNVVDVDVSSGRISLSARVRPGQRVRFFIKDADEACEALQGIMQKYKRAELAKSLVGYSNPPFAAMLFVDEGRGRALFREPKMESSTIETFVKGVPIAGFFGGAQIGPARSGNATATNGDYGRPVVHNAANVIALLRKRSGLSSLNPPDSPPMDVDLGENKS